MISAPLTKLKEIELFVSAGFPVPRTMTITRDTVLDEKLWGPFVVLKPNRGMRGRGISLVRTRDAHWIDPTSWPEDDPRHGKDMLAQQFVNPGPFSRCHRVFTVLGRAIYSNTSTATDRLPALDPSGTDPISIDVAANGDARKIELSSDAEVIALAESIHREFPHIPVMGLDIIRRHETNDLYVMEMNASGQTCTCLRTYGLAQQRKHKIDYYGQFNALGVLTEAFIDATRRLAI